MIAGFLMLYDILAVNGAYLFALFLRFDFRFSMIPDEFLQGFIHFAPVYTISCILIFYWLNLYRSIWRFASYNKLIRIAASTALTMMVQIAGCVFYRRMPVSYYIMGSVLQFVLIVAARFSYRFVLLLRASQDRNKEEASGSIMLIGAGNAGQMTRAERMNRAAGSYASSMTIPTSGAGLLTVCRLSVVGMIFWTI